jgi:hypothetical protein
MGIIKLAPNVPLEMSVRYADIFPSKMGYEPQIRLKGAAGGDQDAAVYLPGKLADNITEMRRVGALAELPSFDPAALPEKGLSLRLAAKHLAVMLSQPAGEKYGRLTLSNLNAGARPAVPQAAAPEAPQQGNGHAGTHAAPAAPAAERAKLTAMYLECLDWAAAAVTPRLASLGGPVDQQAVVSAAATLFIQRCREER